MDRHKLCPKCGYNLYRISSKHCPECGVEHAHYRVLGIFYPADVRNLRDAGILMIPPSLLAATALLDRTGLLAVLPIPRLHYQQPSMIAVGFVIAAAIAATIVAARVTRRCYPTPIPTESRWLFGAAQAVKYLLAQIALVIAAILTLTFLVTRF